jgi:Icc-related predicted phosphoesterase
MHQGESSSTIKALRMKIICISDTHGLHRELTPLLPHGDILVHAGDFMGNGCDAKEILDFNAWLGTLEHTNKIIIPGNHDEFVAYYPDQSRHMITNGSLLINESAIVNGVKVWGGSPITKSSFGGVVSLAPKARQEIYAKVPDDTEIFITHKPPWLLLDGDESQHSGEIELHEVIKRIRPRLHIFGHAHSNHGLREGVGTVFINAALCENGRILHVPTTVIAIRKRDGLLHKIWAGKRLPKWVIAAGSAKGEIK